jgi:hypothetical protein
MRKSCLPSLVNSLLWLPWVADDLADTRWFCATVSVPEMPTGVRVYLKVISSDVQDPESLVIISRESRDVHLQLVSTRHMLING